MRLTICFLLFFVLNTSFAQDKKAMTEEEYVVLKYKIRQFYNVNIDSALAYANQMAKSSNNKHLAFANGAMSSLLQMKGKTELSKQKYKKALFYLNRVPDSQDKTQLKSYVYNYGGIAEFNRRNFGAALEKYQQGLKLSEQIEDFSQILKFKLNITLINEAVGNYQLAIKNAKELTVFLHENKDLFPKEEFLNRKSGAYFSLGNSYEGYFMSSKSKSKRYLLDSAEYFYKKAIDYSDRFLNTKISAKLSLGNMYNWRADYENALKIYYEVALLAQDNDDKKNLCLANYNLADVYSTLKVYDKALLFYRKSDSIALLSNVNDLDYLKSNYYQSKIYTLLKKPELAYKHSKIYLDSKKKYETKLNKERLEVNELQGIDSLTKEMVAVERNYKLDICLKVFYSLILITIIALLIKKAGDKNKTNKKMNALIQEFKANIEKKSYLKTTTILPDEEHISSKKENVNLSIDESKENLMFEKLVALEGKLEYLKADFTLSYVAQKLETNTTYLSYIFHKRFGKSFMEYVNELRINYAIYEMIEDDLYRKSTAQVIAESVGFQDKNTFVKSFRKRTGVSLTRFANNI